MNNPISKHFIKKTDNEKMIKFKKLNPEAVIPTRATALSAGYDLASLESVLIAPGKQHIFKTGIATAFPHSYVGKVESRSGLAVKYGASADLVIFDTDGQAIMAGIIDGDHRGEMGVILRNTGDKHLPVKPGDNIAQLVVYGCLMESKEVDELDETERGNNGFGSTDRKSCEQPIETNHARKTMKLLLKNEVVMKNSTVVEREELDLPRYVCQQTVEAVKIKLINGNIITPEGDYPAFRVSDVYMSRNIPVPGGYFVVYADGYMSFSPADAFESGYEPEG